MTGEQALQCMELAVLRVRDRERSTRRNAVLISALDEIATHLAGFQLLEQCAQAAKANGEERKT